MAQAIPNRIGLGHPGTKGNHMNQNEFFEKFLILLPECQPEAAQIWCDFAIERIEQQQYVHFKAAESLEASIASWLEVIYEGLRQIKETFGQELAAKLGNLGLEHCCLYPGEMPMAAECLREGDGAREIMAKIESGEIDFVDLFSAVRPPNSPKKIYKKSKQPPNHKRQRNR